jgi:hypothetical protein
MIGLPVADAVDRIDAGAAVCYGPMFSPSLERALKASMGEGTYSIDEVWRRVAKVGDSRERDTNMRAKMLVAVMGAAAEARLARLRDPTPVLHSYACGQDRVDFGRAAKVLSLEGSRALDAEAFYLAHAKALVARPAVWGAINAIAFELRDTGASMAGTTVASLAASHLVADQEMMALALPVDESAL